MCAGAPGADDRHDPICKTREYHVVVADHMDVTCRAADDRPVDVAIDTEILLIYLMNDPGVALAPLRNDRHIGLVAGIIRNVDRGTQRGGLRHDAL